MAQVLEHAKLVLRPRPGGGRRPSVFDVVCFRPDVRDLARQHTKAAVETLVSVMENPNAPHSARVAAANGILDRGYGKAVQHIEAEISVYDSLSFDDKLALLNALEELGIGGDDDATRH